jgi:hypothetical protein
MDKLHDSLGKETLYAGVFDLSEFLAFMMKKKFNE